MTIETTEALAALERIRNLTCCCCGNSTRGRQWWNRDTGYGLCEPCADKIATDRPFGREPISAEEMRDLYGVRGVHYCVEELGA